MNIRAQNRHHLTSLPNVKIRQYIIAHIITTIINLIGISNIIMGIFRLVGEKKLCYQIGECCINKKSKRIKIKL
jgi:hypothetical protein